MDGIQNRISTCRQARVWTLAVLTVAIALVAVPARGEDSGESQQRHTPNRFVGTGFERNSVLPARVRPPARVIDARQSPVVAVKSASDRPPTVEQALNVRGSVTFRKTPISEVVFLLSDLWKINIVAGADVTGDVSGAFQNAPLSEVLSATLTASGYGYRRIGNSLVVLPIDQIGTATSLSAGTGAFSDSGIAYYSPQFTDAEQMAEPLQVALGASVIVAVYPEENRIMIKGSPEDLRIASEAIQQLDVPRPQVRITAMIYDVSLGELERLGVNWNRQVRELANADSDAITAVTRSVSEIFLGSSELTTTGATSIGIRTISNSLNASVFLEALDATSEAKLLADPSITVADRTEASIKIVQLIPIVGANPVEGSNAVFTQTEFKEAGVILNVLPRISRDGTIQLQVEPEYSVVSEITAAGPVIDTRTARTVVRVNDGEMFVLGGLRQKTIVESVRGVPYLKEMKHFGKLFRSHSTEVRESELIVFIKPELITPYYVGHPRERMAACVASDQLDRIPHAQVASMIPCCLDPYCANHHPRCRPNLGSYSLEMLGGVGMGTHEVITSESIRSFPVEQAPNVPAPIEPIPLSKPDLSYSDVESSSSTLEPAVVEEVYPVHVRRIVHGASE